MSEVEEYEELLERAQNGRWDAQLELLQFVQKHKLIRPDAVLKYGANLLTKFSGKLGDEYWAVCEQVLIASVHLKAESWTIYCLEKLRAQFPDSARMKRLMGMVLEGQEEWDDAKKIYENLIEETPEDMAAHKRLIAMYKARGRNAEAIDHLNKYLEYFAVDQDVWHELAEFYIAECNLGKASFCFEELVLNNPRSIYNVVTYAELLYSQGDFELSRKYYCLALELDASNIRALWGFILACANTKKPSETTTDLMDSAIDRLRAVYQAQKHRPRHCTIAQTILAELQEK